MNCKEVQKYIALFDEELSAEIKSMIVEHIDSCDDCRKLYDSLEIYKRMTLEEEIVEAPSGLEEKVISKIETGSKTKINPRIVYGFSYGFAAVAVLLIFILIYSPNSIMGPVTYEINFSLKMEKKGKGPADMMDFKTVDRKLNQLLVNTNAVVESIEPNKATGYYDNILVSVPGINFSRFVKELKQISAFELNLPNELPETDTYHFKINFDMINFTSANILGDAKDEIVVQFISGINKGRWVTYERTGSQFDKYCELQIVRQDSSLLANYTMESGDFNGDGFDDILLYEFDGFRGLTLRMLINDKHLGLIETGIYSAGLEFPITDSFLSIKPYDVDHNGTDDLLCISINDSNYVSFHGMNIKTNYKPIKVEPVEQNIPFIFPGDFNSDNCMDVCLKQTWNGESIILTGNGKNGFNEPFQFRRSFAGDYHIWSGDYNGDGLTDLFVKDGGPFLPGSFYLIISTDNGAFEGAPGFQLMYPQLN